MGKRMSALLLVLAVVACAAIGLAACNEGEMAGTGGNDTQGGAGDKIFTEGKTAREIQDAMMASSGYIITGNESVVVLYVDDNNCRVFSAGIEILYTYEDGVYYRLVYDANDASNIRAEKKTFEQAIEDSDVSPEEGIAGVMRLNFEFHSQFIYILMTDEDGRIVLDDEFAGLAFPGYIAGSGRVILSGTTLTIGYECLVNGEKTPAELTISQVNNVKFAPSAEILALKAEAEWC